MTNMPLIRVCSVDEEGRFGGPERRIVQVAKALKPLHIEAYVVYPKCDSEKFAQELSKERILSTAIDITRLSKERKMLFKYTIFFFIEIYRLCLFFRKNDFDLVDANGSYQFKTAIAARLAGVPLIWHLNDAKMDAVVKKICTITARYCASGFIVNGKRVYEYYIRGTALERKPYCEIQSPVDTTLFDPRAVVAEDSEGQAYSEKIVTVSGINPTKGLEYFIQMAENLVRQHNDLVFIVAGAEFGSQKQYYKYLKKLVSKSMLTNNNFRFVGMVDDIPSFLKGADIFVFTSISEAGPMAVWEAMSMGKAVVTTDVGGVPQYIEDGVSGFIVPIQDANALSEKVELLLASPELRQRFSVEARNIAKNKLDVTLAAKKQANFYRQILATKPACAKSH